MWIESLDVGLKYLRPVLGSILLCSVVSCTDQQVSDANCRGAVSDKEAFVTVIHANVGAQELLEITKRIDKGDVAGARSLAQSYLDSEVMIVNQLRDSKMLGNAENAQLKIAVTKTLKNVAAYQDRAAK